MQLVQCSRCGKVADLEKPVSFRGEDGLPIAPADRPQPWISVVVASAQPSYITPAGFRWPSQELVYCSDCTGPVLDLLQGDIDATKSVIPPLVEAPSIGAAKEIANFEEPAPEVVAAPAETEVVAESEAPAEV